jgi:nitric oxide reductase subunit C
MPWGGFAGGWDLGSIYGSGTDVSSRPGANGGKIRLDLHQGGGCVGNVQCANGSIHHRGPDPVAQVFTKSMARNIFYGGSVFFILLFLALTLDTSFALPERDQRHQLDLATEVGQRIAKGKALWENNNCIGCHTLLGEGAYFAPELGNVYTRFGNNKEAIKAYIQSRPPMGIPGRRCMPQFNFSNEELDAIAEFLKYSSEIDAAGWPPNIQG